MTVRKVILSIALTLVVGLVVSVIAATVVLSSAADLGLDFFGPLPTETPCRLCYRPENPAWAPNGRLITFDAAPRGHKRQLYAVRPDGTGLRRVTRTRMVESDPSWSPDGKSIVFVGNRDLYFVSADGTGLRRLTGDHVREWTPAWSPDGKRIAFAGRRGIFVVGVDGNGRRRLTRGRADLSPSWSPDGTLLAFSRDTKIMVVSLGGGRRPRTVARCTSGVCVSLSEPAWSPDARRIAYTEEDEELCGFCVYGGEVSYSIALVLPDGGRLRWLPGAADVSGAGWSPDGRRLTLVRNGSLVVTRVRTGKSRIIVPG